MRTATRRLMRLAHTLAPLALACLLATCTTAGRAPSSDPFAGEGSTTQRGRTYRVTLEVACESCRVNYQVGPRGQQASARGMWRENLRLGSLQRTAIRLTATAHEGGTSVRGVRILVDGESVAEAGCAACDPTSERLGSAGRSFTVETVIPPQ